MAIDWKRNFDPGKNLLLCNWNFLESISNVSSTIPDVVGIFRRMQALENRLAGLKQKAIVVAEEKKSLAESGILESIQISLLNNQQNLIKSLHHSGCNNTLTIGMN